MLRLADSSCGYMQNGSKDSYRGNRRGRFRGMDRALSAAPWRARNAGGRVGPGQLARVVGRRDSRDSRNLWTEPALYEDGGPGHAAVEREREGLEPETPASDR